MDNSVLLGIYVFLLAIFLGIELIGRVPATLHTPLMSGTNAIHGIVLLGGMVVLGEADTWWLQVDRLPGRGAGRRQRLRSVRRHRSHARNVQRPQVNAGG